MFNIVCLSFIVGGSSYYLVKHACSIARTKKCAWAPSKETESVIKKIIAVAASCLIFAAINRSQPYAREIYVRAVKSSKVQKLKEYNLFLEAQLQNAQIALRYAESDLVNLQNRLPQNYWYTDS